MDRVSAHHSTISFLLISLFALLRPIFTLDFFGQTYFFGLNFIELFGIVSSYVCMAIILVNLNKFSLSWLDVCIFLFILYVCSTFLWASDIKGGIKLVLSFSVYFAAKIVISDRAAILRLSRLSIFGYIIPIVGSATYILLGKSAEIFVVFQTGLERYSGMYSVIHAMAHAMFVYIVFFVLYLNTSGDAAKKSKVLSIVGYLLVILAVFNIYKSGTRTVLIGLGIFIMSYFFGKKHYFRLVALGVIGFIAIVMSGEVQDLFFDIIRPLAGQEELDKLGSGRYGLWQGEIVSFLSQSFEIQMIGEGLGNSASVIAGKSTFGSSHNDFIAILVTFGYLGIILYVNIIVAILVGILRSDAERTDKWTYLGILLSVCFMNFSSNSYISRFELAQYFSLIFGMYNACYASHVGQQKNAPRAARDRPGRDRKLFLRAERQYTSGS